MRNHTILCLLATLLTVLSVVSGCSKHETIITNTSAPTESVVTENVSHEISESSTENETSTEVEITLPATTENESTTDVETESSDEITTSPTEETTIDTTESITEETTTANSVVPTVTQTTEAPTSTETTTTTPMSVYPEKITLTVQGIHYIGDYIDSSDCTVTVTMSDGSKLTNPPGFTLSGVHLTDETNIVTVKYQGLTSKTTVTAIRKPEPTKPAETEPVHTHSWTTKTIIDKAAYDEQIIDKPAYDEQVLISKAYDEQVVDKPAWDEQVLVSKAYDETVKISDAVYETQIHWCVDVSDSPDGYQHHQEDWTEWRLEYQRLSNINKSDAYRYKRQWCADHNCALCVDNAALSGINYVHDPSKPWTCAGMMYRVYKEVEVSPETYKTIHHDAVYKTVHHDATYKTIHHDAVYKTVHHDATYKTVHHNAVTHTETVCSTCGTKK